MFKIASKTNSNDGININFLQSVYNFDFNLPFTGQYYQDIIIAYIFFEAKKNGFYVDIGANDGKFISNTYCFEKLGWEGICIEPQPDIFEELKKNINGDFVLDKYNSGRNGGLTDA
jgi:hypothetical protein